MTLFEKALVLHLVGDWILQNDWMARNKCDLRHSAAWVHSTIHGLLLALVLGPLGGLVLGIVHLLIDTRVAQNWWRDVFRQTGAGEMGTHVTIWCDQVIHVATIALWVLVAPGFS
jgi:hypothetical protein